MNILFSCIHQHYNVITVCFYFFYVVLSMFSILIAKRKKSTKTQGRLRSDQQPQGPQLLLHACDDAFLEASGDGPVDWTMMDY